MRVLITEKLYPNNSIQAARAKKSHELSLSTKSVLPHVPSCSEKLARVLKKYDVRASSRVSFYKLQTIYGV